MMVRARDPATPALASRARRLACGLILFSLVAALLAAVGRVDLEPEVKVPVRYAVLVAPLHVGLLGLAVPWLAARPWQRRHDGVVLGAGAALAGVLLVLQLSVGRAAVDGAAAIRTAIERYDAGIREPGMERIVFPDLAAADRTLAAWHRATGR